MKYFKPNWNAINKAIADNTIIELRAEQKELSNKIQKKIDDRYRARIEAEKLAKLQALKDMPIHSSLYYTGRSGDIKFGAEGIKVKDGRTRMQVRFDGKLWSVYYENLKIEPLTPEEITSRKVIDRITNILTS